MPNDDDFIRQPPASDADVNNQAANVEPKSARFRDVETFQQYFNNLHGTFTSTILPAIEDARANRALDIDVEAMRADGKLLPHQTIIGQRIIDINISRAITDYVSYITQSRRLAIFEPNNKSLNIDTNLLEMEFRRVMTYDGYISDYVKWADCALCHGWGAVDGCYDPTKPGAYSVEYVSAGNLMFDLRVKCIQQAPMVARRFEITTVDLREFALDYDFDPQVTEELYRKLDEREKGSPSAPEECNYIYKVFYKEGGKVQTCWYSKDLQKYLKAPEPFYNGVDRQQIKPVIPNPANPKITGPQVEWVPEDETEYPFFLEQTRLTEDESISRAFGFAIRDFYTQEAATSIWSATVNGTTEAANVMWAPKNPNLEAPIAPKQLSMTVQHGAIWDTPMEAFHPPYPPENLPRTLEMLRSQNAEDTNQISFAVNNRRDTRKTATEIEAAQAQDSQMSSVAVTNWATAIGCLLNHAWRVIKSQALQGKIKFCQIETVDPATGQPSYVNNVELIKQDYKILPAGTVDYVERIERINSMQTDWPIVGPTAAGPVFLEEYLRVKYPTIAEKLIAPLQQQQANALQMVQAMQPILQAAVTDEAGTLRPEFQQYAQQLQQFGIQAGVTSPNEKPVSDTTTQGNPA